MTSMPGTAARATGMAPAAACLLAIALWALATAEAAVADSDVHVAYLTDCSKYSDWQAVGMAFSHQACGQAGKITRIMCCKDEERARYNHELLNLMPTHIAPSYAYNERLKDYYPAYNKPGAVVDWLKHVTPEEDWLLVIDSDMLILAQFFPEEYKLSKGWISSAPYEYLIGVKNDLYKGHIPNVAPRNDTFAGPMGRHADQVGGYFFAHRDDMTRIAPLWLKTTEDVRADPEAWRLSGDMYVEPHGKPWICEMYGYVYGAAKADVWHKWDHATMHYPGYTKEFVFNGIPKLMHYGLLFEVGSYKFDKHWHYDFDVTICPPWDLSSTDAQKSSKAGIFPPPPHPRTLKNQDRPSQYYRDLLAIETVATLNAAFCDYHLKHCPPSHQLLEVCTEALHLYIDTVKAITTVEPKLRCRDFQSKCDQWAKDNECKNNYSYMKVNCPKACGECHTISETLPKREPTETLQLLDKLKATLSAAKATGGVEVKEHAGADPDTQKAVKTPEVTTKVAEEVATPSKEEAAASPAEKQPEAATTEQEGVTSPAEEEKPVEAPKKQKGGADVKARKDLLLRCYRMNLKPKEVKECAAAAQRGESWKKPAGSSDGGGSEGVEQAVHHQPEDDGVEEAAEDEEMEAPSPKRKHKISKGRQARRKGHIEEVEPEDEKLTPQEVADLRRLREGVAEDAGGRTGLASTLAGLSTTQAVLLWALVLVAVLYVGPRVVRRIRRRQRSGMRSD